MGNAMNFRENRLTHALANLFLLALIVLAGEGLLQIASRWSPAVDRVTQPPWHETERTAPLTIPDERLGHRGNPAFPNHDLRGFRNPLALDQATIVALGDSQTYGVGVEPWESWPSLLSNELDRSVYNMGVNGYGTLHNQDNLSAALDLRPFLIIFGLYLGGDFYHDFAFAKENAVLAEYTSPSDLNEITALERHSTMAEEVSELVYSRRATDAASQAESAEQTNLLRRFRRLLSEHSKIYGLLRTLKNQLLARQEQRALLAHEFDQALKTLPDRQSELAWPFDGSDWKTILTPPYRLRMMDDGDPRIRAGVEAAKQALGKMYDNAASADATLLVLLLPTKESVFWPKIENAESHAELGTLIQVEQQLREELRRHLEGLGIDVIDPLPALRSAYRQPYPPDSDGHPNAVGHGIIAREILRNLRRHLEPR